MSVATRGLAPAPAQLRRALSRAQRGVALDLAETTALLRAGEPQLPQLLDIAARVRDAGLRSAGRTGIVTYSPKVFIPLTRLCRDRCHYCTFASSPGRLRASGEAMYLTPAQVLDIAERGARAGCTEALFTLGDRPEDRWPAAREWLDENGYEDSLSYLRAMAVLVLERTGLLPHLNPGVMSWAEMARLKPVAASMGLMLESGAERLWSQPGQPHYGSPDKRPAVRLRVLEDAGRLAIPFTSGLLAGIGETPAEFAKSLFSLRRVQREFGHLQEVIIQNFRAKPGTAMSDQPDAAPVDFAVAVAVSRIVLGPGVRLQVPPNLSDAAELTRLIRAGVDDWGGVSPVTADHVNPERPWPDLELLRQATRSAGFELRPRLAVHPRYVRRPDPWLDPRLRPHVFALAGPDGLLDPRAAVTGRLWQEPDPSYAGFAVQQAGGRTDLNKAIDLTGRTSDRRGDFDEVYGDWDSVAVRVPEPVAGDPHRRAEAGAQVRRALALAAAAPARLADEEHHELAVALMSSSGDELRELAAIADRLRAQAVGADVTYVVNRNLNFTNVCYTGCRFCAFAQRKSDPDAFTLSLAEVGDRVDEAAAAGATEICMQGGIHPDLPGTAYFDLAAEVKRRQPGLHLHAFSPMEVVYGASKAGLSIRDWLIAAKAAGVDSIPGTAAEILDDEVRWVMTKGKLPADAWVEVISTAHEVGLPSSATMMYGHVDQPEHWVAHLRLLRQIQERTRGFTEFVGLPFVHHNAPLYLAGLARPGPAPRDDIAVTAMARIMLHGAIGNIQVSWVKLGTDGCARLLAAGANDLGGTLMEETISRMAGSGHGSARTPAELTAIAHAAGRPARQRTTLYERPAGETGARLVRNQQVTPGPAGAAR